MKLINRLFLSLCVLSGLLFASCECHHFDAPPITMKLGWVLCTDGEVISMCDFLKSDKEAIGIVFYVNDDPNIDGKGYAVYIHDLDPCAFSEDITKSQGTSCDLYAHDGNANTYSLFNNGDVSSPMAQEVFELWKFGQSAYVPSVEQQRLLLAAKEYINERLEICGGDKLPDEASECWYWTSTEVENQSEAKAWLFSLHSGAIQETSKMQVHKVRPIITIKY